MTGFQIIRSHTVVLAANDIDTDQIIPARFLTTTNSEGFGRALFADWRVDTSGHARPEFALNRPGAVGCEVLVTGRNFGCGSSREHAVWALRDYGFRAVISTSFADIFRGNALKNGLLPIVVDEPVHAWLLSHPAAAIEIDLDATTITLPEGRHVPFAVDAFACFCLLQGIDELSYLLAQSAAIATFEQSRGD